MAKSNPTNKSESRVIGMNFEEFKEFYVQQVEIGNHNFKLLHTERQKNDLVLNNNIQTVRSDQRNIYAEICEKLSEIHRRLDNLIEANNLIE